MYFRRFIGLVAAGLTVAALVIGADGLIPSVRAALTNHSWSMAVGGLVGAGLMIFVALLTARIAYRNLFWSRYVASTRARAGIATTPPNER